LLCRCRCRRRRARSLALQWCRAFVPSSACRVPAHCRHPHVCTAVVRHALARTPEGLSPSVLSCSPEVQSFASSGQRLMANTHTAAARNAGATGLSSPLWSFPAAPSCLAGNFTVRSDAHARKAVPLYGALALSKPHRPQSRRPCQDRVVVPLALAAVDLSCVLPHRVSPELVVAEPEFRPKATPFFTQTKP
jgi:hypothetical protein